MTAAPSHDEERPKTAPPRLARWLLEHRIPGDEREYFIGDLTERFHEDVASGRGASAHVSVRAARRRFWRETVVALFTHWPHSPRARVAPLPRDGSMSSFASDLRLAMRMLLRTPLFTSVAVLTLAVGIGATSAIFSVVRPILFDSVPYPDPDRVTLVWERTKDGSESNMGYLTFKDLERESRSFSSMAAMSDWQPTFVAPEEAEQIAGQRVTQGFFASLAIRPALGRDFLPEEDRQGNNRVVILGHDFWQRRFGGDSTVIGRAVPLSGRSYTVVGVLPERFESLLAPTAQVWGPLGYDASLSYACRTCRHLRVVGRLKEGVTPAQAGQELDRISANIVRAFPNEYEGPGMLQTQLHEYLTRSVRPALVAVFGAVAFLLAIACANVINLFLGRAVERESEFAVRAALGAGRMRLVRQLVAESLALSLVGGILGVMLSYWGVHALVALGPPSLPRIDRIAVDGSVLLFTLAITVGTGVVAGLVPALATLRRDLGSVIKQGARNVSRGTRHRVRGGLVVAEMALALMLLVGAGLLLRSLDRLLGVDAGFDASNRIVMGVDLPGSRYPENADVHAMYRRVLENVRATPGVSDVSMTNQLPLSGDYDMSGMHLEAKPNANPENDPSAFRFAVTPSYLKTMGIPLMRGRDFAPQDDEKAPPVVLINESIARRDFAGMDPIGQRVKIGGTDGPWRTIVGVVRDVRHQGLDKTDEREIYLPSVQNPYADSYMKVVVRTSLEPASLIATLRRTIRALDPAVPVSNAAPMSDVLRRSTAQRRFALLIFEVFAGVALLLAAAGIYGVLAGSVNERTREIGIRTALGAPRERILALIVRQGMVLTSAGLAIGVAGALAMSRALSSLLFDIPPYDPLTLVAVSFGLVVVALAAVAIPAWRATRVDALVALRES